MKYVLTIIRNLLYAMIVFQVSLNFDPAKEILEIQSNVLYFNEKVIIVRKIQVTMKTFAPPFFNHFS